MSNSTNENTLVAKKQYRESLNDDFITRKLKKMSPTKLLVLGFFFVILAGAIFLNLPIASRNGMSIGFLNALFTATSAVCITGLVVVNTLEQWTIFGQLVILVLVQIGGLGLMTFIALFFMLVGRKITYKNRIIMKEALNQDSLEGIVRLTKKIVKMTFTIEIIGAVFLSFSFIPQFGFLKGAYIAIFHSISAFCNAGFDIIGNESLIKYVGDINVNFTIMLLIIIGGLGFTVWNDIIDGIKEKIKYKYTFRHMYNRFSLHTKLVLSTTIILLLVGFLLFFSYEFDNPNTIKNLSFKDKTLASMFQSVTTRSGGYTTIAINKMHQASEFVMIVLMFIGGSPASTAGGIKTVTFAILILTVLSEIQGKDGVVVYKRRIPTHMIKRSLTVIIISLFMVILTTLILTVSENFSFMQLLFEAVSAYATVGLSLGITGSLTAVGKLIIIFAMFVGRLGPITAALAMMIKERDENIVEYPKENVIVG